MTSINCPYCRAPAQLMSGDKLFPGRFADKNFWRCNPCDAHICCHFGTTKPLGRLANAELRRAKTNAHAAFDRLWRAKMMREGCTERQARAGTYAWLAEQMRIPPRDCHIGHMDIATCVRVVEICEPDRVETRRAA